MEGSRILLDVLSLANHWNLRQYLRPNNNWLEAWLEKMLILTRSCTLALIVGDITWTVVCLIGLVVIAVTMMGELYMSICGAPGLVTKTTLRTVHSAQASIFGGLVSSWL